jgi:hypothetical protein
MDVERHASIAAWIAHEKLANVRPPIAIDLMALPWPRARGRRDCVHQRDPYFAVGGDAGADEGRGEILPPGGVLVTYGPYKREGRHTAA